MPHRGASLADLLLGFAHATAEADGPAQLPNLLVDMAVDPLGANAEAAAALAVNESGELVVAASRGLPASLNAWTEELEIVEHGLGERLRAASGETSREVRTIPLVSGRDIYGALVIFARPNEHFDDHALRLAVGLADVVAVSLDRMAKYTALSRSNAELRASREALAQSEKLRSLGQMAAGISHDLKNILNPLALQLELLRRRLEKRPEAAGEVIGQMEEAIRSGVETVERLRAFSRQDPESAPESVALDDVLTTAVALCSPRLEKARVRIDSEPGGAGKVLARKSELVTAIVNLVFNAIDALENEGIITVRTAPDGDGAWIEVGDTGPGMPREVEERVFEPFFTTKEQGTGLGLATVYAFVKRHGGRVTLETKLGEGTRFRLWFRAAI